ncbi:glycosyltransferase family 39 protein [Streptomyces sp. NPDC005805]|uniref:glycosyltransferase family 39 protein n=1 Tax=Streptomyces sp. NPDC005805 TaxID=3157068 RepID=UPI0033C24069
MGVAVGLGWWGLGRQGAMWRDESVTYQVAHRSLPEIVELLKHADAVHGLHYLLMHALFGVWEGGLIALRLPSVVATAVAAGLVAAIALRLTSRPAAGLASGVVFAVLPEVQMYAQEGRSYAMVCALVALASYVFVRIRLDGPTARRWVLYGLAVAAASLLHEFAVLVLLAHGITWYRAPGPGRRPRGFGLVAVAVVVVLLPLVVLSARQSAQVSWISGPALREWAEIAGVAVLVAVCGRYLSRPPERREADVPRLALPLALAPTAALLAAAVHEPLYVDRYVLYTNIGVALLTGTAAVRLLGRRPRGVRAAVAGGAAVVAVLALLPVSVQMRTPDSRKDDVTALAHEVGRLARPGDAVLFAPARRREWLLSYPAEYAGLHDLALRESPRASGTLQGTERPAAEIARLLAGADRVVVLSDPPGQPLDDTPGEIAKRHVLEREFTVCGRTDAKGGRVTLYARAECPGTASGAPAP